MNQPPPCSPLRAYEITVVDTDWHQIVHARTASKAKYLYIRDVWESWPEVSFKHLRCRLVGAPQTAEYRGVPFARIGMRVRCGGDFGVIVDRNSSANFDVLFDRGGIFNCHPNWMMKYFDESGKLIAEFGDDCAKKGGAA